MELIPKCMRSKQRLIVFLVSLVSFLAKYLTAFLIIGGFIDGYMLIASTYAIITSSIFSPGSLGFSFRLEAWTMESCEQFTFPLSRYIFIPRYPILEKVALKFVAGITNLVENSPFSLIVFWEELRTYPINVVIYRIVLSHTVIIYIEPFDNTYV